MHHIPTRTEVDDLSRAVYELRRELRVLRREARVVPTPTAAKRAPRKRKAR
jgi:hypothetical protein